MPNVPPFTPAPSEKASQRADPMGKPGGVPHFLDLTEETIFYRWFVKEQGELHIAKKFGVHRLASEHAIRRELGCRVGPGLRRTA